MSRKVPKKLIIGTVGLVIIGVGMGIWRLISPKIPTEMTKPNKPKAAVNIIPLEERPYVTLQPLAGRNELELKIYELKKPASNGEVTLEYDRNKGVLDSVYRTFSLTNFPFTMELFLGSKSAGGHITYHEDVIGGTLRLDFHDEEYALEVPWRYDDTQKSYSQLATTDGFFQLSLTKPIKQAKVIVMQSPGLPELIEGKVLAGPFLVGTGGELPETTAEVKIRMAEESDSAVVYGWDGTKWVDYETTIEGKTVSAKGDLVSTYVVVSS